MFQAEELLKSVDRNESMKPLLTSELSKDEWKMVEDMAAK